MLGVRKAATAVAVLTTVALAALPAEAQSVDAAVDDLRDNDVTFEEGALTDQDITDLDGVVSQLQSGDAYLKVVVLSAPVDRFATARDYAQEVRSGLGGRGRVIVFDPQDVGIASSVPGDGTKIEAAELAAIDAANRSNSYGAGVAAAAQELGAKGSSSGGGGTGASGSSGGSLLLLLVMAAVVGVVGIGFYLWWSSRRKRAAPTRSSVSQGEGEQKVRAEVEAVSNLVIDLADSSEVPGASPEAVSAFRAGATEFAELQDDLEAADTREELEAVYPRLVHARWQLQCSKALLEGQPAPPEPAAGLLFPPLPAPAPGVPAGTPAPEPHYRAHTQHSPWLTNAAITAITVLAARGLGNAHQPRRQPSDDVWFGDRYGGGGYGGGSTRTSSGTQSRPRISLGGGRRGRGMGRR